MLSSSLSFFLRSVLSKKTGIPVLSEKRASFPRKNRIFSEFSDFSDFAGILAVFSDFAAILQALEKLRNPLDFL